MHLIEPILHQMSSLAKPQRKFMFILLTALTYLPGQVNFRNLGRYTSLNEKTFSRGFRRPFDFVTFNLLSLKDLPNRGEWVVAIDARFSPKSGRTRYGLDWFSCQLGLDFTAIKSSLGFAALCNYGAIAA
jgi:hypothetical protein